MTRPAPIIAGSVAALVLLLAAYIGSYYAMLKETPVIGSGGLRERVVIYRIDHKAVRTILRPAHYVDRVIRYDHWTIEEEE